MGDGLGMKLCVVGVATEGGVAGVEIDCGHGSFAISAARIAAVALILAAFIVASWLFLDSTKLPANAINAAITTNEPATTIGSRRVCFHVGENDGACSVDSEPRSMSSALSSGLQSCSSATSTCRVVRSAPSGSGGPRRGTGNSLFPQPGERLKSCPSAFSSPPAGGVSPTPWGL
jgi:hypothetical protein